MTDIDNDNDNDEERESTSTAMGPDERRGAITLFATDGLATLDGVDPVDALNYALIAICSELVYIGATLEGEVQPAMKVLGQWVGGVIGTGTVADEEVARTMYERGRELRNHIATTIGWPQGAPIEELRERWAAEVSA